MQPVGGRFEARRGQKSGLDSVGCIGRRGDLQAAALHGLLGPAVSSSHI